MDNVVLGIGLEDLQAAGGDPTLPMAPPCARPLWTRPGVWWSRWRLERVAVGLACVLGPRGNVALNHAGKPRPLRCGDLPYPPGANMLASTLSPTLTPSRCPGGTRQVRKFTSSLSDPFVRHQLPGFAET
jgi:hypothetical protein